MFLLPLIYFTNALMLISCQNDTNPQLLFSNIRTALIMDTDTGETTIVASNIPRAISIDYHPNAGYIYWSDVTSNSISRIKYPSTTNETADIIITEDIQTPDGIAIDPINNYLYWTDTGIDKVMRSELDGTSRTTILDTDLQEPRAILLDTANRWMYLSDWGIRKIEKCKFDGSSRQSIVTDDLVWPNGLALDFNEERIYWVDGYYKQIKSAKLDGSDVQLILKSPTWLPHPFDIDVYSSFIYYSDWSLQGIYKVSKVPDSIPVSLSTEVLSPMGLKIYNRNDDVPSEAFALSVVPGLEEGSVVTSILGTNHVNLEPVFKCSFNDIDGKDYLYDIYWYINGNLVKVFEKVHFTNISTAWLRPNDWVDNYNMNMYVKCSLRARKDSSGDPSPHQYSPSFVAGVIPDSYLYEVTEGSNLTISLTYTVPTGCLGSAFLPYCKETFKIGYPSYTTDTDVCSGTIQAGDLAFEQETCGIVIPSMKWNDTVDVNVYGYVDSLYNTDTVRTAYIRLSHIPSSKDPSKSWRNIQIPNIQIRIGDGDSAILNAICESWSDPRYYTFDRTYFSKSLSGEYVLFRNERNKIWVHTLSTACWDGTCNAGIAIRSHSSLFVVRTSDVISHETIIEGRSHPFVNFRDCDNKNMVVKRHGTQYTATLPTGTEIWFHIGKGIAGFTGYWIWHITIKPSVVDIEQTEGLCGFLSQDNNKNDDFKERSTGNIVGIDPFVTSWYIDENSSESLFVPNPSILDDNEYLQPFCVCDEVVSDSTTPIENGFNNVKCNLSQPVEPCINSTTNLETSFYSSCSPSRRKRDTKYLYNGQSRIKRDTEGADDEMEEVVLSYAPGFIPKSFRTEPDWKNGWTESTAKTACIDGISSNEKLALCSNYVNLVTEEYITPCVEDIKATGGTSLISTTISKMLAACIIEVSKNETLITSPSEGNGDSKLKTLVSQLCQNDCSGHGSCEQGVCACDNGFIGDDCSTRAPTPSGIIIPFDGRCDKNIRTCETTFVNGDFQSTDVWYKKKHFRIINNMERFSDAVDISKAEYFNPYMVRCYLGSSRRKRDTRETMMAEGYYLSFSVDGTTFGDESIIIIYDSVCFSCNATTVSCTSLESCQSTVTESNTATDSSNKIPVILGSVFGIVIIILLIVGVVIWYKHANNKKRQTNDNFEDYETSNVPPVSFRPTKEKSTISQLDVEILDTRPSTPYELFLIKTK